MARLLLFVGKTKVEEGERGGRGRGDSEDMLEPATAGIDESEWVVGWKSNSGASRGATPYCIAISRPRSRGILKQF